MPITDLIIKASNGTAPVTTTLASAKAVGASSLSVVLATGWPTDTAVFFKLYQVSTSNTLVAGTETIWKGTVSGTTVSNLALRSGTEPVGGYPIGSPVEPMFTSATMDDLYLWGTQDHDSRGRHKTLHDTNGNTWLGQTATGSAVNYVNVTNAAASGNPIVEPAGTDTNISLLLRGKGTGKVLLPDATVEPQDLLAGTGTTWVWQAWTPTFGSTGGGTPGLGNGTLDCAYIQMGKTVMGRFKFVVGATSDMGTGATTFTLPVAARVLSGSNALFGQAFLLDSSGPADYGAFFTMTSTTVFKFEFPNDTVGGGLRELSDSATQPFDIGPGDVLQGYFMYEAA